MVNMKEKFEKEKKETKEKITALTKWIKASIKYMLDYLNEDDFENAKVEAEDIVDLAVWISEELEAMARLKELLEDEGKDRKRD